MDNQSTRVLEREKYMSRCQCHNMLWEDCPRNPRSPNHKSYLPIRVGIREWSYGPYKIQYDWDQKIWKAYDDKGKVVATGQDVKSCYLKIERVLND